ncbi:hypothetical protein [Herbidospora mongoliensis]|uniref:hypothetical protein n=1 Tax=Herbidospora mongoliensis TaxID=688067 RepID=UPI000834F141|nr:hypothetical protein [Herbidospora mongoliensis]
MLVVQRVLTRWSKVGRGAAAATLRGSLPDRVPLPACTGDVVFHDVIASPWSERLRELSLPATAAGLRIASGGRVSRAAVFASYPRDRRAVPLFTLAPGRRARYRANFRFSGHSLEWYYEQWTVTLAHDVPLDGEFHFDVDDRVRLYP